MGMPIEDAALEVIQNDADLNIHKGRIAALTALNTYCKTGEDRLVGNTTVDIPPNDQRLDNIALQSYNSIRNSWIAMYGHWKHPDLFVVVQGVNGSIYTQVNQHVLRASDHSQASLF